MILQWMHSYCGAQAKRGTFQQKAKHTLGTNPIVAYDIVLQCGHRPPLLDYHTGSCSPTLQNKNENNMDKFKEKYNAQLWSWFIKCGNNENLLKTCSIHAHDKLKYSLTGGFNHTNSLHCPATASCLGIAHEHHTTWECGHRFKAPVHTYNHQQLTR